MKVRFLIGSSWKPRSDCVCKWRLRKRQRREKLREFWRNATMPCLNLSVNVSLEGVDTSAILSEATSIVAKIIGKPESVRNSLSHRDRHMEKSLLMHACSWSLFYFLRYSSIFSDFGWLFWPKYQCSLVFFYFIFNL